MTTYSLKKFFLLSSWYQRRHKFPFRASFHISTIQNRCPYWGRWTYLHHVSFHSPRNLTLIEKWIIIWTNEKFFHFQNFRWYSPNPRSTFLVSYPLRSTPKSAIIAPLIPYHLINLLTIVFSKRLSSLFKLFGISKLSDSVLFVIFPFSLIGITSCIGVFTLAVSFLINKK